MSDIWKKDPLIHSLDDGVILCGYRGSIAHGTYEENTTHDDKDVIGIFIPPENCIFGIDNIETVERMIDEKLSQKKTVTWDIVYYSFKKYISLIEKQNPNVLSLLWLSEKYYIKRTKWGNILIDNRDKLISRQVYQSFSGYAYGQLHRMSHPSTGRMGAKRKELFDRFGYDVKNAAHLIRLLKMGGEALATGELLVERPDNNMLLEIKRGEWEIGRVKEYADGLFKNLDLANISSKLPNRVSHDFLNKLCVDITKSYLTEKAGNTDE